MQKLSVTSEGISFAIRLIPKHERRGLKTRIATTEKSFVVHAEEKLTAFLGLELVIRACGELVKINHVLSERRQIKEMPIAFGSLKVAALLTDNIYPIACGFLQPPSAKFKRRGNTTL